MSPWSRSTPVQLRRLTRDLPPDPGVTLREGGIDVSVYAGHAERVELCLYDPTGEETRIPLVERTHGWWFGFIPGVGPGQRYGFRVYDSWDPSLGLRHNGAKLLLDPYAKAIEGEVQWGPAVYGHVVDDRWIGDGETLSELDSAPSMPRCVVIDDHFDWEGDTALGRSRSETVIYEAHVKNLTRLHPGIPEELRGTYAALAHPVMLDYLTDLGVTAVELLPIHAFTHEPALVRRGLSNHWGYNTLGFHAPHAPYAAATDPQAVVDEVKGMVKLLHRRGIEVILDVVYNHTAEQDRTGAMLSWRGLDNRAYYRLDERGADIDVTGCGNTLDLRHPVVCRMVLDSLRRWVQEYHVDGFRFDLAVALGRGRGDEYDPDHPFLVALRTDPVLSRVKLIAEPWDVGMHGWRTGQFPPPFSEWNDRYRDAVRTFWGPDVRAQKEGRPTHGVTELATRLAGSRDLFGHRDRGPVASVNFITAHDGFTAYDLTAYDHKHNEANGEDGRDGSDNNQSWNHGVEGEAADPLLMTDRRQTMRNLLGTLLLSTGIPMLNAGDEFGRTQGGNNNPYCQDNEISWFSWDWSDWQRDLHATVRHLIALRGSYPALSQRTWALGLEVDEDGSLDMEWFGADGTAMDHRWAEPTTRTLQWLINGAWLGQVSVLVVLHGGAESLQVRLPEVPGLTAYQLLWDSAWERPQDEGPAEPPGEIEMAAHSIRLYAAIDPT